MGGIHHKSEVCGRFLWAVIFHGAFYEDTKLDEKMNASSTSLADSVKPAWGLDVVDRVNLSHYSHDLSVGRPMLTRP